jgi:LmbE family N-acetylglucosaminyl deacetylase
MKIPQSSPYTLVVVAHPDDETIFFAGAVLRSRRPVHVVCVTDGNADGSGRGRYKQFTKALQRLGVKGYSWLEYPDIFKKRLSINKLVEDLRSLPTPAEVFTHGPLGEYGHPHHQDVCLAVHRAFSGHKKLWGVAHNCVADRMINLSGSEWARKANVFSEVYFSETRRFASFVPASQTEAFCRYSLKEVESIYAYFTGRLAFQRLRLQKLKWFKAYLKEAKSRARRRPF